MPKINFNRHNLRYFFTKSYIWPLVRIVSMRRFLLVIKHRIWWRYRHFRNRNTCTHLIWTRVLYYCQLLRYICGLDNILFVSWVLLLCQLWVCIQDQAFTIQCLEHWLELKGSLEISSKLAIDVQSWALLLITWVNLETWSVVCGIAC